MIVKKLNQHDERGQVAIISVMFFMILFAVIILGFMRVVVSEQRQTLNNELSSRATSSAEAGIEDAKRILEYCKTRLSSTECAPVFSRGGTDSCSTILNSTLMSAINTKTVDVNSSKQAVVANSESQGYAQYYTCLIVKYYTDNYTSGVSPNGMSSIVPLKFVEQASGSPANAAAYFTLAWHNTNASANGPISGLNNDGNLPTATVWNNSTSNRPAVVRVQLVTVPKSGFNLDGLTNSSRAVTLRPSTSASGGQTLSLFGNTVYNLDYWAQSTQVGSSQTPLLSVNCNNSGVYACQARFTLAGSSLNLTANDYYLRIQSVYRDTEFRITANSTVNNATLYFDGVQPSIDVTGRSSDSFKRLSSRVEFGSAGDAWWPDYAVDSASPICKQMSVRSDTGSNDCSY